MKGARRFWFLLPLAVWAGSIHAGNKFEIIGGGVSGSGDAKLAFVEVALYGVSAVFFIMAALAVMVPRRNALFLNYANWRQSAVFALVLGVLFLIGAVALD